MAMRVASANNSASKRGPVALTQQKHSSDKELQFGAGADSDSLWDDASENQLQFRSLPLSANFSRNDQFPCVGGAAASNPTVRVAKVVTEYPLPGARETHEMVVVADRMLVVSQQTNSTLVKLLLDPSTGSPVSCAGFVLDDFWAGLHGLTLSKLYEKQIWATLQFTSVLIRIDPNLSSVDAEPAVRQRISLPSPAKGPHCIVEYESNLWTCCKDSSHVVRIRQTGRRDFNVYPCSARPIFVVRHPTSYDMYASLDISSKIWRLIASNQQTEEIDIPAAHGRTPVGLIAGPDGNVWFTLAGGSGGGLGTFARILPAGDFQWFSLSSPIAPDAGLIHLGFDPLSGSGRVSAPLPNNIYRLWLLSTTLIAEAGKSVDGVFSVLIDTTPEQSRIVAQESIMLPSQRCATHRVLPHGDGLFVSQMLVSSVAHITGAAAFHVEEMTGEKTDFYVHFGMGQKIPKYDFQN